VKSCSPRSPADESDPVPRFLWPFDVLLVTVFNYVAVIDIECLLYLKFSCFDIRLLGDLTSFVDAISSIYNLFVLLTESILTLF
jgi:hypothetical protein